MPRITVWDPVRDTLTLRDAMDRLIEESFVRMPRGNGEGQTFTPRADAWEDVDGVTIEVQLPGVDPDQVDITFEQDSLVVSGETMPRDQERNWVLTERPRGRFHRRFSLNVPVQAEQSEARYSDGILTLRLPKREETKPRKIAVQHTPRPEQQQ